LAIPLPLLEAFGLYLVRTSALIVASPILGSGTGFASYRITLIVAVALVLFLSTGQALPTEVGAIEFGMMCLHEVLVGLFLAFVLQSVLMVVRVAGELIGVQMAFNMADIVDPSTGIKTPLVTQVYEIVFLLGLLAVNGHHWLLRALGSSFERAPIGGVEVDGGAVAATIELFSRMFSAGVVLAAPVMVLLLMVSVVIGLLARVVPQVNVLEVGFNVRVAVGLLALLLFSPFLAPAMDELFSQLMLGLDGCLDSLEA